MHHELGRTQNDLSPEGLYPPVQLPPTPAQTPAFPVAETPSMFRRREETVENDPLPEVMPTVGPANGPEPIHQVVADEEAASQRALEPAVEIRDRVETPSPTAPEATRSRTEYPLVRGDIYVEERGDDGMVRLAKAPPEVYAMASACHDRISSAMLDAAPPYICDTDIAGVDAFFAQKELRTTPAVILRPDQMGEYAAKLSEAGIDPGIIESWPDDRAGTYLPAHGVIVIREDPFDNTAPLYVKEYVAGKEKAHSSMRLEFVYDPERDTLRPIAGGFLYPGEGGLQRGNFFEQGYTCMRAREYVTGKFDTPTGMRPADGLTMLGRTARFSLPAAYVLQFANGSYDVIADSAFSGYGMELLCERIPALGELLDASRASFGVLKDIKSAVDSLEPGLYDFLDALPGTEEGYVTGLRKIQEVLSHERESSQGDRPPETSGPAIEVRDREEAPGAQSEFASNDHRRDADGLIHAELIGSDGEVRRAPIDYRQFGTKEIERLRQLAIDLAPPYDGEISEQKVDDYFAARGLTTSPAVIVKTEDMAAYDARLAEAGAWPFDLAERGSIGRYEFDRDLIIVEDRGQHPWDLMRTLVHEKAHSTMRASWTFRELSKNGWELYSVEKGFVIENYISRQVRGAFFEEGWPSLVAAKYMTHTLWVSDGIWPSSKWQGLEGKPGVPSMYAYVDGINAHAWAAFGLELLCMRLYKSKPEEILIRARTSRTAREEFKQAVNSVRPGLYEELFALRRGEEHFIRGLYTIYDALGHGTPPLIGPDGKTIQNAS